MNILDGGLKRLFIPDEPVIETLLPKPNHVLIIDNLCRMAFEAFHDVGEVIRRRVVAVFALSLELVVAESSEIGR